MSEQNIESFKNNKNALMEISTKDILEDEKLNNLLDFLDFLKDNKLTPRRLSSGTWVVKYKGKTVCHLRLKYDDKDWRITLSHFTREKRFVD